MIPTITTRTGTTASHRRLRHRAFASAMLVLCLLVAQWVGYAHAIAHWHGQEMGAAHLQQSERIADASPVFDHQKASGACAALDAATLGAGLCSSSFALPAVHVPQRPPVAQDTQRWLPAFSPFFPTRAPPLNA